jgi:hypothetical protein
MFIGGIDASPMGLSHTLVFSGTGKTRIVHKTRSFVFCCFRGLDLLERVTILSLPPAAAADDQEEGAEHIRRPPEPRELDVRGQKTFENELHPQSQPLLRQHPRTKWPPHNTMRPSRTTSHGPGEHFFFFLLRQTKEGRQPRLRRTLPRSDQRSPPHKNTSHTFWCGPFE